MLIQFLVFSLFLLNFSLAEEGITFEKDEGVYVLTDKNFDAFLEQNPTTLIEFYAPWCVTANN